MSESDSNQSGWEKADAAVNKLDRGAAKVGRVTSVIVSPFVKIYGILLVIGGFALLFTAFTTTWYVDLILIAYGVYLLIPGRKTVVW